MKVEVKVHKSLAFALGGLNFLHIADFAQVIIVEMLLVFAFLIGLVSSKGANFKIIKEFRVLFIFGILWLFGQASSDFANRTDWLDSIKSLAQIIVLLCLIYWGFYWANKNVMVLKFYLFGYCFSSIPQYIFLPGLFGSSDPWKFIFGPSITLLACLMLPKAGLSKFSTSALLLVLVSLDLALGARSLGLITLLTIFMLLKTPLREKGFVVSVIFLVSVIVMLVGVYNSYANLTINGAFGQRQAEKFERQSQAGPILLVARSELLYELQAIRQTGILGLGSAPEVDQNYLERVALRESNLGINHPSTAAFIQYNRDGRIPIHSMILGAWVESGLFGVLFWFYLTWLVLVNIVKSTGREPIFGLACRYLTINYLWAVLFSPLGAGSRMMIAITISLVLQERIRKS
jgi:hypothetical protein